MTHFENNSIFHENVVRSHLLPADEEVAVTLRADVRRRMQELKIRMLNSEQSGSTDAMKATYKQLVTRIFSEMAGEWGAVAQKSAEELRERALGLTAQAETAATPLAAANARMQAAKLRMCAGDNLEDEFEWLQAIVASAHGGAVTTPLRFLPDATLIGMQKKVIEHKPLPSHERVAHALKAHRAHELLRDWALVMPEEERTNFLTHMPHEHEREVGTRLDESVTTMLHGARVESAGDEARQRKAVRARVYNELRMAIENSAVSDTQIVAALGRSIIHLGSDTKNLVLDIVRDEMERRETGPQREGRADYIPHLIGVLLKLIKETDDFRANDVALQLLGDAQTAPGVAASIFRQLIQNKYLDQSLGTWWNERRAASQSKNPDPKLARGLDADRARRLEVFQAVIGELGVVPSREVVEFLDDDAKWGTEVPLHQRALEIKKSEKEFAAATSQRELVAMLAGDEKKAMTYFLLHGGEDRFNLINNYGFDKFKEILGLINKLTEHKKPIAQFMHALQRSGIPPDEAAAILDRLRGGHFYSADRVAAYQTVNFEVSENAAVKNANAEIGRVLGKDQLGRVLLVPMYRQYLEHELATTTTDALLEQVAAAETFEQRGAVLIEIEKTFPEWRERVKKDLEENWRALGEKMVLGVTLANVLDEPAVSLRAEELIPRLNSKRVDLKRTKKDLIVALKSDNEKIVKIRQDIERTRQTIRTFHEQISKETNETKRAQLEKSLTFAQDNLVKLEKKRTALGNAKISDRYTHLSKADRDSEIEKLGKDIVALTEKSASAIFTYLTMQVIGEERLTEQDRALILEMESHLQGPFQVVVDAKTYQTKQVGGPPARRRSVGMDWLDKRDRFMNMVRFADSKICCFSSSNYQMRVQHDTENKYWVASINADPMSFVIALEQPQDAQARVHENDGFIFGSFATDEKGDLAVMLNGIYYAPGVEDSRQVEEMLGGVERMLAGLPVKTIAIASQHGGSVKMPKEYEQRPIQLTRLRAIDGGEGEPESKVYDDLGTGTSLNAVHGYDGLWVKQI